MFLSLSRKILAKPRFCCVRVKHFMRTFSDDQSYSFFDNENRDVERIWEERAEVYLNNLDGKLKERKDELESLVEEWYSEGTQYIPDKITASDWMELLQSCFTDSGCIRYLKYSSIKERRRTFHMMEKMKNRKLIEENNELYDHLYHLDSIRDLHIIAWKKLMAWRSENPIVIDLDFQDIQGKRERVAVECIRNALKKNIFSPEPSNIHVTSFRNYIRMTDHYNAKSSLLACTFCEDHFLDLFPREKIIYLSPYAPPMKNFDPDAVYVVGGIQYKGGEMRKFTFLKAQKYGLKCVSFPLKDFVRLKVSSSYILDIDTSVSIVNSMYFYHCWKKAFQECLDPDYYEMRDGNDDVIKHPRRARIGSKIHLQTINEKVLNRLREINQKKD